MKVLTSDNEPVYTIGIAAHKMGVAIPTLRMYEREGLILPFRTPTGRRIYSNNDLMWIDCIRRMITKNGINLEGIRRLLALMPCWKLTNCPQSKRKKCPAFQNSEKPCWMIKLQANPGDREKCRNCPVYSHALHCEQMKPFLLELNERNTVEV